MKKSSFTTYMQSYVTAHQIRMVVVVVGGAVSACLTGALFSYNPFDPSWAYTGGFNDTVSNVMGSCGAHCAAAAALVFGCAMYSLPIPLFFGLYHYYHDSLRYEWDRVVASIIGVLALASLFAAGGVEGGMFVVPGGVVGSWLYSLTVGSSDQTIAYIGSFCAVWASSVIVARGGSLRAARAVLYVTNTVFSWEYVIKPCGRMCIRGAQYGYEGLSECVSYFKRLFDGSMIEHDIVEFDFEQVVRDVVMNEPQLTHEKPIVQQTIFEMEESVAHQEHEPQELVKSYVPEPPIKESDYAIPDIGLFSKTEPGYRQHEKEHEEQARVLEEKLERFGVSGKVVSIESGPVITMFEYQPHIDSKISKIIALEDDLALALQAVSIRIIAPIPGKSVVGFEVAKKRRDDVLFSDIVHSKEFMKSGYRLPIILGCDTTGHSSVIDLASTPHLLVAGSTGSGKSVALNAMLISLLCTHSPDDLNLILIDPKRLEFASYADIAHLVFPIITEPRKAAPVLQWVLKTMNERYEIMSQCGMRNVTEYRERAARDASMEPMPWLVVVIDELSDLMMTAGKDVEELIARIAQMARAAGIHLIVATQRPSVDVITGLIKVNFPSRISFKVTSKVDSRTILDGSGAEKLLGRGDMLYLNAASTLQRIHGAYVTQAEIDTVVNAIRAQRAVEYRDLELEVPQKTDALSDQDEQLYQDIIAFIKTVDDVSISLLQRRFRIGYNRSARIIDLLEADGYIMPADGGKTRKVIH